MKPYDRTENQLVLCTSVLIGILGFFVVLGFTFSIFKGFRGEIILNVIIVILASAYSFIAGHFFSKSIIDWFKIKSNCYLRAFWYGVLGGLITILLTAFTIGAIIHIIDTFTSTAETLSRTENIYIIDVISKFFTGLILGLLTTILESFLVVIGALTKPLVWVVFLSNGVIGIAAFLIYRKKLNIK